LATRADVAITAGLRPDFFAGRGIVSGNAKLIAFALSLFVVIGFGLRVSKLGAEGLSEDELNKLETVYDYRQHGLTSANSEHPLLMKALQTATVVAADKWNSISSLHSWKEVSPEAALRLPSVIFGALSAILIYLMATELFGVEIGLLAAALWSFDPTAIGLNRIAKEDTFLLFFFLLANVFMLIGQRVAEQQSTERAQKYYWATAAAFGAMMASKYLPQLILVSFCYYWIFQNVPATRWRLGKKRLLMCIGIMTAVFIVLNIPILMPSTWKQMGLFAGQKLIGHDGYEFMGKLYTHRLTDWLRGIPWYFYHVLLVVKLPLPTVAAFLIGLPLLFTRRNGDGRYLIILWLFLWMMTFSFAGGKFGRYFTTVIPPVLITAALGVQFVAGWLGKLLARLTSSATPMVLVRPLVAIVVLLFSFSAAIRSSPHFRLYTNALGGGLARAGFYFPHDEFYDASVRDAVYEIAKRAPAGSHIASETPTLSTYYAQRAGRTDLSSVWLSDPTALEQLHEGDFVIIARGRRYFSNEPIINTLQPLTPAFHLSLGQVPSASVYVLDKNSLPAINAAARQALAHTFHAASRNTVNLRPQ
jgi:hypothetical protein